MIYRYQEKKTVFSENNALGFLLANTDNNDIVKLEIAPQGEIPAHSLPMHVTFYVISGQGTVVVEGRSNTVTTGDIIEAIPGISRGWKNESTRVLEVLVIKEKLA